MYICNCNGIRENAVHDAIMSGANTPRDIFKACQTTPQCAKCVCDMRALIAEAREAVAMAAE